MSSSWLTKQKKDELKQLAEHYKLKVLQSDTKVEIQEALENYFDINASSLLEDTRIAPYFHSRKHASTGSPVKKETKEKEHTVAEDAEKAIRNIKKRVTKAAGDALDTVTDAVTAYTEDTNSSSSPEPAVTRKASAIAHTTQGRMNTLVAHTPRAVSKLAQQIPLPPSPSVVADAIERRTSVVRQRVATIYESSGVMESAETTREMLSTVTSVEVLIFCFEAWCLRSEVLAGRYAFTIPSVPILHTKTYPVHIPDMFLLLTSSFWGPVVLWIAASLIVPGLAAYFFNLTSKPRTGRSHVRHFNYSFDPMTFNIVKALVVYLVFEKDATVGGLVDLEYVARINSALYGGPWGVITGCGIGILITFYEAIISK